MKFKRFLLAVLFCGLIFTMSGCSAVKKFSGTYLGNENTLLYLQNDGTCMYKQDDWDEAKSGTWTIKDKVLTVSGIFSYDIYASATSPDNPLLFQADSSHWNDEVFTRIKK